MAASVLVNSIFGGAGGNAGEIAVLVEATLPSEVVNGTLVVITDQAFSQSVVSDTEPQDVSAGFVWVQIGHPADNCIGDDGAEAVQLMGAYIRTGSEWLSCDAYYPHQDLWVQFSTAYTIMGYEWSFGNSSPLLARIEAAVGLNATASVGTVAGQSDFDNMPIYRDIRRCNLAANGVVNAYEGDPGFSLTGSAGDVMVEIPKFYYKVEHDTVLKLRRFMIADKPGAPGFAVHPLFDRPGGVREKVYIAAFETGAAYTSKSGVAPLVNQTRAVTRTGARGKGTGWSVQDAAARQALAELIRIEFATHDVQAAIGQGRSASGNTTALNTGGSNTIAGHTGRAAGTDGTTAVVWRGIENLWGNVWEWIDGINFNNGALYVCLDPSKFADDTATNYTLLSFTVGTALSTTYATGLGFDPAAPWASLPSAHSGGSATTYLCDACWSSTGWRVPLCGGSWSYAGACGVAAWAWNVASSDAGASFGSRLLFLP